MCHCPSPASSAIIFCPALRKVKATAIGPRSHVSARRILGFKTHFVLWKATEMLAMSWGAGTIDCGSFSVSFTQALHSSSTIINGQSVYLGNNGIVIKPQDAYERLPHGRHRSGSRFPLPAG